MASAPRGRLVIEPRPFASVRRLETGSRSATIVPNLLITMC